MDSAGWMLALGAGRSHLTGCPIPPSFQQQYQNGESEENHEQFLKALQNAVTTFVNRMKSNHMRGRSITNDSAVLSLFQSINNMHPQLLELLNQLDERRRAWELGELLALAWVGRSQVFHCVWVQHCPDAVSLERSSWAMQGQSRCSVPLFLRLSLPSPVYYEGLQDKLAQIRDARGALNALREEHQEKLRRAAEEAERQRQIQLAQKLEIMRQKKQVRQGSLSWVFQACQHCGPAQGWLPC